MSENKEKGGMKISWVILIIFQLAIDVISRVVESMYFIDPERFLVKGIESQSKTDDNGKQEDLNFFLFHLVENFVPGTRPP
jgi:hypothetical protein